MNLYLSIAFTLLAAVAGMYLLAKTKTENLGKLFSFVSYLVLIVAGLSLICQLGRGAMRMACRTGVCPPSESCMPGMMIHKDIRVNGMHGGCGMHAGCRAEEDGCEAMGHGEGMRGCGEMGEEGNHGDCCRHGESKGGCMKGGEEDHGMKKGCMMDMKKDSSKTK